MSSSSPLGPPKLTTSLKKQPAKPPSQQSSPGTPEIISIKCGVLLYKILGVALKEAFKSPAPFLSSSYSASNQSLPASPAKKGNVSTLPTSNVSLQYSTKSLNASIHALDVFDNAATLPNHLSTTPTDPTPSASVWTFPLMPKNVQGTSGRADIHSAENATSEPNAHKMNRPQIVKENASDGTRTHLVEPGVNVQMHNANGEAHSNDNCTFHSAKDSSLLAYSLMIMYQTALEALSASLLRSGQIKPSRPSPPMSSISMCCIHVGIEPECPPPGKNYCKTDFSENGFTSIVQCLSLDDWPGKSFKASDQRSQLVHKYHDPIGRKDQSSTQRGSESQVVPLFSVSFVNSSQVPPIVSNTPTNLTWSNADNPPRPSPPMPCTPLHSSHDNTEPDCPTPGKHFQKTHVPAIAYNNSAQCSTLTELPDISTLSAQKIKVYLHKHNRHFMSSDKICQLVYKYKHASGESCSANQNQYSSCTQASQETKEVSSCDQSPTGNEPSSSYVQTQVDLENTASSFNMF
ncbi:hypothetical protein O181_021962 [Austropuccinia psidii MF-1]|uniref:Uncharacterized protein n=1 Tax=Austropuccinia psidii MF-1 TaxID=1389203 RepID=A0A9Q3GWP7_9BASI|nr:hypothetical protein [Austropuccinia psidii MF-1]